MLFNIDRHNNMSRKRQLDLKDCFSKQKSRESEFQRSGGELQLKESERNEGNEQTSDNVANSSCSQSNAINNTDTNMNTADTVIQTIDDDIGDKQSAESDTSHKSASNAKKQQLRHGAYAHLPLLHVKKGEGIKTLYFQPCWKDTYKWIFTPVDTAGVLCNTCVTAARLNLMPSGIIDGRADDSFITGGFTAWNKALERFSKHEKSDYHTCASGQLLQHNHADATVNVQLSEQCERHQQLSREALLVIISTIRFLARQGIAIRGHEHNDGNFMQLLYLRCNDNASLKSWLSESKCKQFTSWLIQNEILELLAHEVLRDLCAEIHICNQFAVIVDGTTDITHQEQEAIAVRFVNDELEPCETFLGFYNLTSTTSQSVANMIFDVLLRLNLPLSNLRGQTYDGGSNMAGRVNGAQAIITERQPLALFVHCLMHCGNLVASECMETSPVIRDAVNIVNELGGFFHHSTKLTATYRSVPSSSSVNHLRPLCPTRVLCRGPAIKSIVDNVESIVEALEEYSANSSGEAATKARGFITAISNGSFLLCLKIALTVVTTLENLNTAVQSRKACVSSMIEMMKMTVTYLQNLRSADSFGRLFTEVEDLCTKLDIREVVLPRQRAPPRRFTGPAMPIVWNNAEEYYRSEYNKVIDIAIAGLITRYDQPGIAKYISLEQLLLQNSGTLNATELNIVKDYPELSADTLTVQLAMIKQQDWRCDSVMDYVNKFKSLNKSVRNLFGQVQQLLKLLLTLPCSNAEAERSFSCLRRLKTYLRSSMSQERLNHVTILHVHQETLDRVDICKVAKEFVEKCESRRKTFGHFRGIKA